MHIQTPTVYDLLMICPDDQITRLQIALRAVAAGDWDGAAHSLRNAAKGGNSDWHDQCAVLAVEFQAKASRH